MKKLARELCRKIDVELKHDVAKHAAFFEHRLVDGQKAIIHMEAFIAKFMAVYKKYLVSSFG